MAGYLLGIDNGATVAKVVLFDLEGRVVQIAARTTAAQHPRHGWAERNMDELWGRTAEAIRAVIGARGVAPHEILAVGLCGHGNGLYLLDAYGDPLRPAILSMDARATDVVAGWEASGVLEAVRPQILQTPYAGQPPALLRWLKLYEPASYARIGAVLLAKDFVKQRLTGVATTDPTDICTTGLYDLGRRSYSADLLAAYGIPEIAGALPPVVASSGLAGRVSVAAAAHTGLLAGTPVVSGLFDVSAGALGAGVIAPGQLCVTAGTWSVNALVSATPADHLRLFSVPHIADTWLRIDASPSSCANLEWFVQEFCAEERAEAQARGISPYEVCGELVAALPPVATSVVFHPFLYGANGQPSARAGFYGLAGWHTRAELLRALFEGVAYGHRGQVAHVLGGAAVVGDVRLIGGGARSPVWAQIFADVLELPLMVPQGREIGARGAALSAGVGCGVYGSYEEAAAIAVAPGQCYLPNATAALRYRAAYTAYQRIAEAMAAPWESLLRLEQPGMDDGRLPDDDKVTR